MSVRRQDKISNGCNTSEKVKHLYLNLGSKELFTSVVILMTGSKRKYQLTMELTFRYQQSQNVNAAAGGGCTFFNPLYTNEFFLLA